MRNQPTYPVSSVDTALLLATVLRDEGPLRLTDAAARLGTAPSTAHRLLAALVHRDFAVQLPDRRYAAGPQLGAAPVPASRLHAVALPHLRAVVAAQGESAHLVVRAGADVRFVATVECDAVLRVGDRTGRTLPAHRSAAGKALLAALDPDELAGLLSRLPPAEADRAHRELRSVRRRGFAVNDQATEAGLTAVGVAVPGGGVGISLAMPRVRFSRDRLAGWVAALTDTAVAVAVGLTDEPGWSHGSSSA
ncbi:IclR family transcriptional regulator [Klenkia sp. PcliD-1-E]|uniref:IclR family transcriptional regulator n=1 Tax=Klenkia sp. PcliD-1-E TaxID=2954492 RepID=UPI002096A78D|nr:IclR family transcriptional regulator C-terminal domain-containing protein [Klenkia sp. PcliD-1-E]MCO7218634.1 helix-turn-helix domain-containing protein [Klenkia sp. PcliD-1-E]